MLHDYTSHPSYQIWEEQSEIIEPDSVIVLNYFADSTDSLYIESCYERAMFYELFGLPATIVNGINSIYVYYESTYLALLEESLTKDKTFIGIEHASDNSYINPSNEKIIVRLDFLNTSSYPLESTLSNLTAYVALSEFMIMTDDSEDEIYGDVLKAMYSDNQNIDLTFDGEYSLNCELDYSDLSFSHDIIDEREFFKIIFWIQNTDTKEILYSDSFTLDEVIVDNQSDAEPISKFNIYPNPTSDILNFNNKSKNKFDKIDLKIFNVKGQLVTSQTITDLKNDYSISLKELELSSGIYFVQTQLYNKKQVVKGFKKVLFLK